MIASQKIGKSFLGALNYNLKKLYHPDPKQRAELLDSNFSLVDSRVIQQELKLVRSLKPNLGRYVYHTSLNFSKEDVLDNHQLLSIAHDYLREMGYTNNQYLIFRHYDADHPHIHLLVNRISFDGAVVSDSNNYQRSEAILRKLERHYNLTAVAPSNQVAQKAATKDELEMVMRTGKASEKMVLQELMKGILSQPGLTIRDVIAKGEQAGIHFLFNQASTGRVTGITYFNKGFKIKGQALGNQYKWSEIIKKVNYEQGRDSQAISQANSRTTAIYGIIPAAINELTSGAQQQQHRNGERGDELYPGSAADTRLSDGQSATADQNGTADRSGRERSLETDQDAGIPDDRSAGYGNDRYSPSINIEIADDVDDEAIHGRNRHRKQQSRTNRR